MKRHQDNPAVGIIRIVIIGIVILIAAAVFMDFKTTIHIPDGNSVRIHLSGSDWNGDNYIKEGISFNEDGYTWTDAKEVIFNKLKFDETSDDMKLLINVVGVYHKSQRVIVNNNGSKIYEGILQDEPSMIEIPIDKETLEKRIGITINLPDAISPKEVEDSTDKRKLGIKISSIEIGSVDKEDNSQTACVPPVTFIQFFDLIRIWMRSSERPYM